jgi:catalase
MQTTVRSSFRKADVGPVDVKHDEWVNAQVELYTSDVTEDDFLQAKDLWELYKKWEDDQVFINNICGHLGKALPEVQKETISKRTPILHQGRNANSINRNVRQSGQRDW